MSSVFDAKILSVCSSCVKLGSSIAVKFKERPTGGPSAATMSHVLTSGYDFRTWLWHDACDRVAQVPYCKSYCVQSKCIAKAGDGQYFHGGRSLDRSIKNRNSMYQNIRCIGSEEIQRW